MGELAGLGLGGAMWGGWGEIQRQNPEPRTQKAEKQGQGWGRRQHTGREPDSVQAAGTRGPQGRAAPQAASTAWDLRSGKGQVGFPPWKSGACEVGGQSP